MTADLVLTSMDTTHWTANHSWNSNRTIKVEMVSKMVGICCSWCHRELLRTSPYTLHVMSSSAQTSTILVIRLYAECDAVCQGYAEPNIFGSLGSRFKLLSRTDPRTRQTRLP